MTCVCVWGYVEVCCESHIVIRFGLVLIGAVNMDWLCSLDMCTYYLCAWFLKIAFVGLCVCVCVCVCACVRACMCVCVGGWVGEWVGVTVCVSLPPKDINNKWCGMVRYIDPV